MGLNSVTLGIVCWGDVYWPRFGARWLASIKACNPQPDRIMIATDRELDGLPDNVEQILTDSKWLGWNLIAKECETTWMFGTGVDDELMHDSFAGIEGDEDAIAFGCQQAGETTTVAFPAGSDAYQVSWQLPFNPMNGGQIFRASALQEIPYRDCIYCDEVLFAEWSYFGKQIKFENRVRLVWHRWVGSNSWPANRAGEQQAQEFKARLRAGLIQKGVAE